MVSAGKMQMIGLKEADAVLKELPSALAKDANSAALMKAAEPIRAAASRNAPVGDEPHRTRDGLVLLPGFLRAHIKKWRAKSVSNSPTSATVVVGIPQHGMAANAWYGRLREKEYGGVHGRATPWLRPAFDSNVMQAVRIYGEELSREILKAAEKLAGRYGAVRKKLLRS